MLLRATKFRDFRATYNLTFENHLKALDIVYLTLHCLLYCSRIVLGLQG